MKVVTKSMENINKAWLLCDPVCVITWCHPSGHPPWRWVFWQPGGGGGGDEVHPQVEWLRGGRPSLSRQHGEIIVCLTIFFMMDISPWSGHLAMVRLLPHGSPEHRRGGLLHLQGQTDGDLELLFTLFTLFSAWNCGRRWLWSLAESWALILQSHLVNSSV